MKRVLLAVLIICCFIVTGCSILNRKNEDAGKNTGDITNNAANDTGNKDNQEKDSTKYVLITADVLNIRKDKGTDNEVIGKVQENEIFPVIESGMDKDNKEWYKIKKSNVTGWIAGWYCRLMSADEYNSAVNNTKSIEEQLAEHGLPLTGKNIFDPKKVKVGDKILGLKVTSNNFNAGTKDYPFDTNVTDFAGEIILTGTLYNEDGTNDQWHIGRILFAPDKESLLKLPISHHDTRETIILDISNQEDIKKVFNISSGEKIENAKIRVKNYKNYYWPTEGISSAAFIEKVK
jgi:hypothetical protein